MSSLSLYGRLRRHARIKLDQLKDWGQASFIRRLDRSRRSGRLILVFDHRMGGGSNIFRERLIATAVASGDSTALLVTIGREDRQVECHHFAANVARHRPASVGALLVLLQAATVDEIVINDLVTWPDPIALIAQIRGLAAHKGIPITVYVHDHFFLCPSWSLLDYLDKFCGLPDPQTCNHCLLHHEDRFVIESGISEMLPWRQASGGLLEVAEQIVCFSNYTADLVRRAFPGRPLKLTVRPHQLLHEPTVLPRPDPGKPLRIGVLGNIGFHKGARIVDELAELLVRRELNASIVVIGRFSRPARHGLVVHGNYDRRDLTRLIEEYGIQVFLFPSIWPETFSYVCAEVMALEMPLVAFNLGAPAERIRDYPLGVLVDEISAAAALEQILRLHRSLPRSLASS